MCSLPQKDILIKVDITSKKSAPNLPNFFKMLSSGGEEVEEEKRLGRLVEK